MYVVNGTAATIPRLPTIVRTISVAMSSSLNTSAPGWALTSSRMSNGRAAPT
jgi:hypothetical protein